MNKPPAPLELQRLTDNGSSVGGIAPLYTSVDVAQSEHKEYLTQQSHTQGDYTSPGELDPPNEYDIVTDKQRENTSPGYLHQQNNVLYADQFAATEMRHATLTRTEQNRYVGVTTLQGSMDEPKETECTGCNGGRSCLWITLCALLIFISLVAIAALVLAVMMMLQVIPVCNCAPSPQVQELMNRIQVLENRELVTGGNISSLSQRLDTFNVVPAVESAIAQRITNNGTIIGLAFSAELVGFQPYADCVTEEERECTISNLGLRCETPDLEYIMADNAALNYTRDARCVQKPFSTDQQHLSTTLLIQGNIVFCVCERVIVQSNADHQEVSCALQMTRCRSNRNIPVEIVTTSNAQLGN